MAARKKPTEALDDVMRRLDEPTLRRLLDQAAMDHPDVERAVRLAASGADGRLVTLRDAVDIELEVHGYLDYRDADDWADDAQPVITALADEVDVHPSRDLLEIVERAIRHAVRALQRGDDSSGSLSDVLEQVLELHLQLCEKGVAEPIALAKWLAKFMFEDQDYAHCDPVAYADALGEEGLAEFRKLVDEYAKRVPVPWNIRIVRERLVMLDGDVDSLVAVLGGDLTSPHQFIRLAVALLDLGRPDDALSWARRGIAETTGWQVEELYDIAAHVLTERGDLRAVLELRGQEHERRASAATYMHVRAASTAVGTWPGPRDVALQALAAKDPAGYVDILLTEGDVDAAWAAATTGDEWEVGHDRWVRIAEAREVTHPADAMSVYLGLVETTLEKADTRAYPEGVWLLKCAQRAAKASSASADFDAYVRSLRERFRRRPSLISQLDRAKLR